MNRDYIVTNEKTGEQRVVSAFSARDALYQVAGWCGLSIRGLDYRSGLWMTSEPYPWWYESVEEEVTELLLHCECGADYQAEENSLRSIGNTITCQCGNALALEDDSNERRYQSIIRG